MLVKHFFIFCAVLCFVKAKDRCPTIKRASPYAHVAEVGSIVRLKCDFLKWDSSWSLNWYKNGEVITRSSRKKWGFRGGRRALSVLRVKNVRSRDSGIYECVARSKYCIAGKRLHLTVSGPDKNGKKGEGAPWFIKQRAPKQFFAWPASQDLKFRCAADGEPPLKYQWLKDGKVLTHRRLDPKLETTGWYLRIKTAVPSDNGLYKCIVSNRLGNISRDYKLTVIGKEPIRPVLSAHFPVNKTARVGDNVTFQCIDLFSPMLTDERWLHWKKLPPSYPDLKPVEMPSANSSYYTLINPRHYKPFDVDSKRRSFGGRVYLNNITKADEGMYTCLVTNHIGKGWKNAFLTVVDSEISKPLKRADVTNDSGKGKMVCSVIVTPKPEPNHYRHFVVTLKSVRPDDAEPETHACNVSDRYDSINMTYKQSGIERARAVLQDFRNVEATEGENVTLTCKAFNINKPKLIWFAYDKVLKQYKMVREGDRVEIEAVSDENMEWQGERLRLFSVLTQDSTEYLCLGINVVGTDSQSLMLEVLPKKTEGEIVQSS